MSGRCGWMLRYHHPRSTVEDTTFTSCVLTVLLPILISTYTTGMPQLKIIFLYLRYATDPGYFFVAQPDGWATKK
jgi:hypothetical protein